jgi:hypothetical protein
MSAQMQSNGSDLANDQDLARLRMTRTFGWQRQLGKKIKARENPGSTQL